MRLSLQYIHEGERRMYLWERRPEGAWSGGRRGRGRPEGICWPPTGGDLLAAETPSRRGAASHRDAEPARESAGRRGRRQPEGRAAAGGEPAAL
jgi:hypothetical protein